MGKKKHIIFSSILTLGISATLLFSATTNNAREVLALEGTYYSSITASNGKQLLGQLHDLITKTHTTYTSYADCKNSSKVELTDAYYNGGVAEDGYITDFYSGVKLVSAWDGGDTWNREHVWCQSNTRSNPSDDSTKLWGESGGGSDLHHIRPTDPTANSTRNNNRYGEVTSGKACYGKNGALNGYYETDCFEPLDNKKGDCARILFYLYTHYNSYSNSIFSGNATTNGSGSSSYFGSLSFTQNVNASSEDEAIELLLNWNTLDPVDDLEINRNEAVYGMQGNRNPYIDHPEYANAIWGDGTINTNVEVTSVTLNKSTLNLTVGESETLTHEIFPNNATVKTVTWTSSNPGVATVSNGVVIAKSAGTTTITVSSNNGKTATCLVTVSAVQIEGEGQYTLVTNETQLAVGSSVVITAKDSAVALSTTQNTNNRGQATITKDGNCLELASGVQVFTLENGSTAGTYALNTGDGYIYAASSASNHLRTQATLDANASWKIEVSDDGTSSLVAQGANTRNVLQYNSSSSLFSCYSSASQKAVSLYILSNGEDVTPTELESLTLSKTDHTLDIGESFTLVETPYPTNASYTLTWTSLNETVATVENGFVSAKNAGTTTITATAENGVFASCDVTVNAKEEQPSSKFEKVNEVTDGEYLIVYEDGGVAFNGGLTSLDAVSNNISVTISNSTIEANNTTKAATFTIDVDEGTVMSKSGYYIGQTIDDNGLKSSTTTTYTNTFSFDGDGNFNTVSGGAYLRYNSASNQTRFRYYKSGTYTAQKAIQLYKLVETSSDSDVTAVENFINNFMHPEIETSDKGTGECVSYYQAAKEAFLGLTKDQRKLLAKDYTEYFTRLQAWAIANGETIELDGDDYIISSIRNNITLFSEATDNTMLIFIIIAVSACIIVILTIHIRKRKTRQ